MNKSFVEQICQVSTEAPVIVIVPNGFVSNTQSILAGNSDCLLNVRVVTFKTLFNLLCDENLCDINNQLLDDKTATLYMWRAINDVRHDLAWFNKNANQYALAEKLITTLDQLHEEQIEINNLPKSPKFDDFKIVFAKYKELTENLFNDTQIMNWLINNLSTSKVIQTSNIFVAGFPHPTKQQSAVFGLLKKHSKSLAIDQQKNSITADNFVIKCENIFDEAERIANAIRQIINNGARYYEIKVIIDKSSQYIYESTFKLHGIPYNSSNSNNVRLPQVDTSSCVTVSDFCDCYNSYAELQPMFDRIKTIAGTMQISHKEFQAMTDAQLSRRTETQNFFDRVTLTSLQEFIPHDVPYLFITNATEGSFPKFKTNNGIINDADNIGNDTRTANDQIRANAFSIMASATKQLFISYALTNAQGEHTSISEFVVNCLPKLQAHDEQIASPNFAKSRVMAAIGSGRAFTDPTYWASVQAALDLDAFQIPNIDKEHASISGGKQLFLPDNSLRVTQIENFVKCPFNHFLSQGLKLKKKNTQVLAPSDVGTILHKFAEIFAKNTTADVDTILTNIVSQYKVAAFEKRALLNRCKQIAKFLMTDIETSQYKPALFEYPVESNIDGITLRGVIDRVDTNGKHAIAIDYKSGSVSGPKLQLPLYLNFLAQKGFIPDGAYYLSLKSFKKIETPIEEIEPAINTTKQVIKHINDGVVLAQPFDVNVCKYCLAGAMCRKRFSKSEGDE